MKKYLSNLILFLSVVYCVAFLLGSLYNGTFNPTDWDATFRANLTMGLFVGSFWIGIFTAFITF